MNDIDPTSNVTEVIQRFEAITSQERPTGHWKVKVQFTFVIFILY